MENLVKDKSLIIIAPTGLGKNWIDLSSFYLWSQRFSVFADNLFTSNRIFSWK